MFELTKRNLIVGAAALAAALPFATRTKADAAQRVIRPGEVWRDTAGNPIQAHGGSMIVVGETFYWYGENKEKTVGDGKVWTWGVRCYASKDLYDWEDLGLIIPPDIDDPTSPLAPNSGLDRPHILYNAQTKKFVCWIKILNQGGVQTRVVLAADKITGPYRMIHRRFMPLGMGAGDFDLVVCPDDGKAYMYFERVHSELICADLTDDFTDVTGYYSTHFPRSGPPYVREAPAYFRRNGKHYLATSGTTGYFPNPSEIASADTYHGPWTVIGDLHPKDRSRTSFNSQISSVFKHPNKKDLYIALADRWMGPMSDPDFESGKTSQLVRDIFAKRFVTHAPLTAEETVLQPILERPLASANARYAWLPIRFEGDRPVIDWRSDWSLDDFA